MSDVNLTQQVAFEQAFRLYHAGQTHYRSSRLADTVEQFDRARRLAAGAKASHLEDSARFWQGVALHGMGRLHEALAVWAPALTSETDILLSSDRYMMLTRYVLVAIDMPLRLETLERALQEVESRVQNCAGGTGLRSRTLLARARLALALGKPAESLELGLEALSRQKRESPTYTRSTHYRTLARAGLEANQPDLVAELLDEWNASEHLYMDSKRLALTGARANLARYLGNAGEALRLAEKVIEDAIRSQDVVYALDATFAFVRACLAARVPERARIGIRHLTRFRYSAVGQLRFDVNLLLGDYHIACSAAPADAISASRVNAMAVRARRAFSVADTQGATLDDLLSTTHRRELMIGRKAQLARLVDPFAQER